MFLLLANAEAHNRNSFTSSQLSFEVFWVLSRGNVVNVMEIMILACGSLVPMCSVRSVEQWERTDFPVPIWFNCEMLIQLKPINLMRKQSNRAGTFDFHYNCSC